MQWTEPAGKFFVVRQPARPLIGNMLCDHDRAPLAQRRGAAHRGTGPRPVVPHLRTSTGAGRRPCRWRAVYFRSRHAAWTFTVCVSHGIDASAIDPPSDEPGFFQTHEYRGYYLSGDHGKEHEASFMRYDEAEQIIRECVRQYLRAAAEVA